MLKRPLQAQQKGIKTQTNTSESSLSKTTCSTILSTNAGTTSRAQRQAKNRKRQVWPKTKLHCQQEARTLARTSVLSVRGPLLSDGRFVWLRYACS